jgi:membrane protein DedA with SNARE-associated domain
VQVEFEQHHTWGIFVSRCLPIYRAVVPALSGIMHIPARRAIPAIAAASAMFYGLVVWLAYTLGQNWAGVKEIVGRLGVGLLAVSALVTIGIIWLVIRRRRAHG